MINDGHEVHILDTAARENNNKAGGSMEFSIHPRKSCLSLLAIVILLAVAHLGAMISLYILGDDFVYGLIDMFDLNLENNIPTVFSTLILMTSAVLLAVIAGHAATIKHNAEYWKWLCHHIYIPDSG